MSRDLDEQRLEDLKKKHGIDELIAERYAVPVDRVKEDFDPRLVRFVLRYLDQASGK